MIDLRLGSTRPETEGKTVYGEYRFDLGKDQDGNPMPPLFGDTPVTIDSADDEISIGRFINSMEMFLDSPEEGLTGEDHYKLTALLQSLERGYYAALDVNKDCAYIAEKVLDGMDPAILADDALWSAHRWFELQECALPPAGAVADEVERRGLSA